MAGHRSLGLDQVLADVAALGLNARWTSVRASDVGAPHHRERLFILVSSDADGLGLEAERLASRPTPPLAWDHDRHDLLAGISGAPDIEREIRLRWGGVASSVMTWALMHGPPPPIIEDQVTYHDEALWGKAFPDVKPVLNPEFASWMMGLPAGHVTAPEIGLARADQLKAIGNGVCPQQAEAALLELLQR